MATLVPDVASHNALGRLVIHKFPTSILIDTSQGHYTNITGATQFKVIGV